VHLFPVTQIVLALCTICTHASIDASQLLLVCNMGQAQGRMGDSLLTPALAQDTLPEVIVACVQL